MAIVPCLGGGGRGCRARGTRACGAAIRLDATEKGGHCSLGRGCRQAGSGLIGSVAGVGPVAGVAPGRGDVGKASRGSATRAGWVVQGCCSAGCNCGVGNGRCVCNGGNKGQRIGGRMMRLPLAGAVESTADHRVRARPRGGENAVWQRRGLWNRAFAARVRFARQALAAAATFARQALAAMLAWQALAALQRRRARCRRLRPTRPAATSRMSHFPRSLSSLVARARSRLQWPGFGQRVWGRIPVVRRRWLWGWDLRCSAAKKRGLLARRAPGVGLA